MSLSDDWAGGARRELGTGRTLRSLDRLSSRRRRSTRGALFERVLGRRHNSLRSPCGKCRCGEPAGRPRPLLSRPGGSSPPPRTLRRPRALERFACWSPRSLRTRTLVGAERRPAFKTVLDSSGLSSREPWDARCRYLMTGPVERDESSVRSERFVWCFRHMALRTRTLVGVERRPTFKTVTDSRGLNSREALARRLSLSDDWAGGTRRELGTNLVWTGLRLRSVLR
jgi:hypothetical protein